MPGLGPVHDGELPVHPAQPVDAGVGDVAFARARQRQRMHAAPQHVQHTAVRHQQQRLARVLARQVADLEPLRAELMSLRGRPLDVDASQVSRLGGLCLQVLMSARKIWAEDGVALTLNQPSLAFSEQLAAFGNPELHCEPEGGLS